MAIGGLYYEEFTIGMRFEHVLRRTVIEEVAVCKRTALMKRRVVA